MGLVDVDMTKTTRRFGRNAALSGAVAMLLASPLAVAAQEDTPPSSLDIPKNVQIFGKLDPNIRKPTAIVNGSVITGTDVDQRANFFIAARELKLSSAETEQLKQQILRLLVDETLQIQQAQSDKIKVTSDEVNRGFETFSTRNFGKAPADLRVFLRGIGSSERSIKRQIEAELNWNKYLRREVDINVGDVEVKAKIEQAKAAQGTEEYHVREIYLSGGADRGPEVLTQMQQMMQAIQKRDKGEDSFGYYARNFSEASTKVVDGDLGWMNEAQLSQLPAALTTAVKGMTREHLAGPIEVPGGYSIIYLVDTRKIGVPDPREARLTLKQVSVAFPAGITQAEANARVANFAKQTQTIHGCGDVANVARQIGAEVVDNDQVQVKVLPVPLQDIMLNLRIGESTPPFGSPTEGIRSLVLCGREDPQAGVLPGLEQTRSQLENQRVNLRANQLMRDLRRDAIVEYK